MAYIPASLWKSAKKSYSGAKAAYKNVVNGPDFNQNAYQEAVRGPRVGIEAECFEDGWEAIEKPKTRGASPSGSQEELESEPEPYMVKNTDSLSQIRLKFSRTAAASASEAADVSLHYAKCALKFAAVEVARDIGFLAHCRTATDVVKAVKARFPVLEDMQRAYEEGMVNANPAAASREWQLPVDETNYMEASSNLLEGLTICSTEDEATYDPKTKAEVEIVYEPVVRDHPVKQTPSAKHSNDYVSSKEKSFGGECNDVELSDLGGVAVKPRPARRPRRSAFEQSSPYDDEIDGDGPIIGSLNDSEELKAKEARTEKIVEVMERRGSTAAVVKRLRSE